MRLIRRSQWGAPATSAAAYISSTRGVKVHYLGERYTSRAHDRCDDYVRDIRAAHLANKKENYSDIAYSMLVCEHGYVYEGRGAHKRTGANGNYTLNSGHYAVCALLGSEGVTEPTDAMLHGIRDAIEWLRTHGDAGNEIKGHRDGYATACPGGPLYAWVQKGAPRPGGQDDDGDEPHGSSGGTYKPPAFPTGLRPNSKSPSARGLQKVMKALGFLSKSVPYADNYGPRTQEAVARFHNTHPKYRAAGLTHDTAIGPRGWAFAHTKAYGGK